MASKKEQEEPKPVTLKCAECDHENEPQRVFCHNCGAKLDRTVLAQYGEDVLNPQNVSEENRKRVAKLMDSNRLWLRREVIRFFKVIGYSILAAIAYLLIQKPKNIPPAKSDTMPERDAQMVWGDAMMSPTPVTDSMLEDSINAYLKNAIKEHDNFAGVKFKRAYVKLLPGVVVVNAERDVMGFPFYTEVSYKASVEAGVLKSEVVSTHFGRLGIHPKLGMVGTAALDDVWSVLKKKHGKQMARVTHLQVIKGAVGFASKPAAE